MGIENDSAGPPYRCFPERMSQRPDKQRIADRFDVSMGLEEPYLEPQDNVAPGSIR